MYKIGQGAHSDSECLKSGQNHQKIHFKQNYKNLYFWIAQYITRNQSFSILKDYIQNQKEALKFGYFAQNDDFH